MRAKFVFDPRFSLKTAVKQLLTALITSLAERKSNQMHFVCFSRLYIQKRKKTTRLFSKISNGEKFSSWDNHLFKRSLEILFTAVEIKNCL